MALTLENAQELRALLGDLITRDAGGVDRGAFYLRYYELTGSNQALIQGHITTYSGFFGGSAIIGNAIAKFSDPNHYNLTLDQFSYDIADALCTAIENSVALGGSGVFADEELQEFDRAVWDSKELGQYFPGNIQLIDNEGGIENLLSAGTLGAVLAGLQYLFGGRVGNEASQFSGPNYYQDTSIPDVLVIREVGSNKVVFIEEQLGVVDQYTAGMADEPALGAGLNYLALLITSPFLTAIATDALAAIVLSNDAATAAAIKVGGFMLNSLFSDADVDLSLAVQFRDFLGGDGHGLNPTLSLPSNLVWDDFPIALKQSGVWDGVDDAGDIGIGVGSAALNGNAGEDILVGFANAALNGGTGSDWLFVRDSAEARGGEGSDLLGGLGQAQVYGDAGSDWIVAAGQAEAYGGEGNDTIIGLQQAKLNGGSGNDIILQLGTGSVDAGAGDDWVFGTDQAKIDLGAGNDLLLHAGDGSVVYGGAGEDTFLYADGVLIADADGADNFSWYGISLENALEFGSMSESGWAYFTDAFGLVRGAVNGQGEIGVQDAISIIRESFYDGPLPPDAFLMYFSNFNMDPLSDPADRTAGIRLAKIVIENYSIMDGPSEEQRALRDNNATIWELMKQLVHEELDELPGVDMGSADPLVLDLDGDGIELSARSAATTRFDVDGDGFAEQTGWVRGDDALLVADLNGNGQVDGFHELFGSPNDSGFAELKSYDSNDDGKVDASDALWGSLRVWQDKDADGIADAGEMRGLTEAGIESLSVAFTAISKTNAGNDIAGEGSYTKIGGGSGTIADVRFDANQFDTVYQGDTTIDPAAIAGLPNLKGHGTLADLHVALSQDAARVPPTGLAAVIDGVLPTLNVLDLGTLRDRAMIILRAWAHAAPDQAEGQGHQVFLYESVGGSDRVIDSAYEVRETIEGVVIAYWKLTSGDPVLDGLDAPIEHPTLAQVLAQDAGADRHWAEAPVDAPDAGGNPDIVILIDRSENRPEVVNFALEVTETVLIEGQPTQVTYWKLASGSVLDAENNVIDYPTQAQILAQAVSDPDRAWEVMPGATLDFVEGYFGINVPLDDVDIAQAGAIAPISDFLGKTEGIVELRDRAIKVRRNDAARFRMAA